MYPFKQNQTFKHILKIQHKISFHWTKIKQTFLKAKTQTLAIQGIVNLCKQKKNNSIA